jgi:hypothetical protein
VVLTAVLGGLLALTCCGLLLFFLIPRTPARRRVTVASTEGVALVSQRM